MNDDCSRNSTSCLQWTAVVGVMYAIQVDGYGEAWGSIRLLVYKPVGPLNDNFAKYVEALFASS
jgi:hypothetical protein